MLQVKTTRYLDSNEMNNEFTFITKDVVSQPSRVYGAMVPRGGLV